MHASHDPAYQCLSYPPYGRIQSTLSLLLRNTGHGHCGTAILVAIVSMMLCLFTDLLPRLSSKLLHSVSHPIRSHTRSIYRFEVRLGIKPPDPIHVSQRLHVVNSAT
ncbi:hypothetical protein BDW71DRAFT_170063 [Aspergillus fruticulosus]